MPKNTRGEIKDEISRALGLLGADSGLLTTVGSWGDALPDKEVLRLLKEWNARKVAERQLANT
ncbi:MAG TPA: hypothetical protein VIW67_14940 [Terriglobales bacterium]|jgi:hypothetical protein